MRFSRRYFLKTSAATGVGAGLNAVAPGLGKIAESVVGPTGLRWEQLFGGKKFIMTLRAYRGEGITTDITDAERAEVLKILLRDFIQSRAFHGGAIVGPNFLITEAERIRDIRVNSTPELLAQISKDPNFIAHTQRDELEQTVKGDMIEQTLDDIKSLTKLNDAQLKEEYGKREVERVKNNLRNVVKNLVGITVDATGYQLSCQIREVCNETMEAVRDLVGREIPAGTYKTKSFGRKTRTAISGGKINEIMIAEKDGQAYTYPKDKGKEHKLRRRK